jgi:hypothetical protein
MKARSASGGATDTIQNLSVLIKIVEYCFVNNGIALYSKCIGSNNFLYRSLHIVSICESGMTSPTAEEWVGLDADARRSY